MKNRYSFLLVTAIIAIFTLIFNGCCLWGIKGKEKPQKAQPVKDVSIATQTPIEQPKARVIDKNQFIQGKYDVIQEIKAEGNDSQVSNSVNWSKGYVTAGGYGISPPNTIPQVARVLAREAAYNVALANLLGTIKGIHINSTVTIENAMVKDQKIVNTIEGVLRGATVINEAYKEEDKTVTAFIEVAIIIGDLNIAIPKNSPPVFDIVSPTKDSLQPKPPILTETLKNIDPKNEYLPDKANANLNEIKEVLEKQDQRNETVMNLQEEIKAIEKIQSGQSSTKPYTGIVINACYPKLANVYCPQIHKGKSDDLIYGYSGRPSNQVPNARTPYLMGFRDAILKEKVGSNPIEIDAIDVKDGDIYIDVKDAEKLESLEKQNKFLEQAKIVIVQKKEEKDKNVAVKSAK